MILGLHIDTRTCKYLEKELAVRHCSVHFPFLQSQTTKPITFSGAV